MLSARIVLHQDLFKVNVRILTHTHTHTHTHTCVCVCVCVCVYIYIYIYIHTHTHTHTQTVRHGCMSNALGSPNMADFLNVISSNMKSTKKLQGKKCVCEVASCFHILDTVAYYITYYSVIKYFIKKIKALIRRVTWLNSA